MHMQNETRFHINTQTKDYANQFKTHNKNRSYQNCISPVVFIKKAKMKFVLLLVVIACATVFVNSLDESQYNANNPVASVNRELLQIDSEIHPDSAVEAPGEHGVRNKRQFFGGYGGYGGYGGFGRRRFGGYGGYGGYGGFRRRGFGGYGFYG